MLKDLMAHEQEVSLGLTGTMRKEVRRRIHRVSENYEQEMVHRASACVSQLRGKMSSLMLL